MTVGLVVSISVLMIHPQSVWVIDCTRGGYVRLYTILMKVWAIITGTILAALLVFIAVESLIVMLSGKKVPTPTIPKDEQVFGAGEQLTYVVMGDSTTVGHGAAYTESYAYQTAQYLAKNYKVKLKNVGVSGSRAKDVATLQLPEAVKIKPDLVLLSVGANDATHFTKSSSVRQSLQTTIDGLRATNPDVVIVVTGSPQMGSVARFPWPARDFARLRTAQVNKVYESLIIENRLFFAPIAAETGQAFADDPTLFAQDRFHPNARGYALWTPVINRALDEALAGQTND